MFHSLNPSATSSTTGSDFLSVLSTEPDFFSQGVDRKLAKMAKCSALNRELKRMNAPDSDTARLSWVLSQQAAPVALRLGKGHKLRVKVPYAEDNRRWLQDGKRTSPKWLKEKKQWEIPSSWFNDFVERALIRYGKVYVIQPFREQEKCAPACWNAIGHECQCSCMGAHHGAGNGAGWFVVSDTFATRWGTLHLACRLMTSA